MTDAELKDKIAGIEQGPVLVAASVAGLDDATLDYKPNPQKWSIREIVAHLADVEVLYAYRFRQMLADREPVLAPIDQDDWARNLGYRHWRVEDTLDQFNAMRRSNVR